MIFCKCNIDFIFILNLRKLIQKFIKNIFLHGRHVFSNRIIFTKVSDNVGCWLSNIFPKTSHPNFILIQLRNVCEVRAALSFIRLACVVYLISNLTLIDMLFYSNWKIDKDLCIFFLYFIPRCFSTREHTYLQVKPSI